MDIIPARSPLDRHTRRILSEILEVPRSPLAACLCRELQTALEIKHAQQSFNAIRARMQANRRHIAMVNRKFSARLRPGWVMSDRTHRRQREIGPSTEKEDVRGGGQGGGRYDDQESALPAPSPPYLGTSSPQPASPTTKTMIKQETTDTETESLSNLPPHLEGTSGQHTIMASNHARKDLLHHRSADVAVAVVVSSPTPHQSPAPIDPRAGGIVHAEPEPEPEAYLELENHHAPNKEAHGCDLEGDSTSLQSR